jgi:hypothetical protein
MSYALQGEVEIARIRMHLYQSWDDIRNEVDRMLSEAAAEGWLGLRGEFDAEGGTVYSEWTSDSDTYYMVIYGREG